MNLPLTGAFAAGVALTCLLLVPLGSASGARRGPAHPERSILLEAGWKRSATEWEIVRAITVACGVALMASFGVAPIGLAFALAPSIVSRVVAGRHRAKRARRTVVVAQLTLAALRSGASLAESLRLAVDATPGDLFAQAVRSFDLGAPLDVALRDARAQSRDRRTTLALDALTLCAAEQLPVSRCVTILASAVDRLTFEQRTADELHARTAGVRVQILLLAALVPGLALYLALTVPGLAETLATPVGRFVLLPLAALLEAAGIFASRYVLHHIG